jgi:tetratricopeptide (TPR) repeat protein
MKRWLAAGALGLAPALGSLEAQDAAPPQAQPPSVEARPLESPFYEKYLVFGNPLDDEIRAMEKRIEEQPGDANLHNDLGNLLALRGFPEQASDQYLQAAKLDKSNFIALYNLGLLRETEGKTGDAISAYQKSIKRKPGFPPSRFRLGRLYEQEGKLDDAVTQYAKAFWIDPSMRNPKRNPLVIDSDLMYRASLANYERDLARATLERDAAFHEEPAYRQVPVDRSVDSYELTETETEPAPREVGPGSGVPATSPGTARRPRPTPPPDMQRMRAPGSRPPRPARPGAPAPVAPAPAREAAPPPAEEPAEMTPPENVEPPQAEPTPEPSEEEVEPS